uniref:Macaca fascicularis brain cDNA, clone: QflA-22456 n=1 Tax=Macaca fascicularis TaxID=9541 RepID=I7GMJ0_MACFA|nr:unnamed protein product [Macaca fascicularis]
MVRGLFSPGVTGDRAGDKKVQKSRNKFSGWKVTFLLPLSNSHFSCCNSYLLPCTRATNYKH